MNASEKKALVTAACKVRMGAIEATHSAKSGHPGGSLSAADMFSKGGSVPIWHTTLQSKV